MTQLNKQIAEIASSLQAVQTNSTVISTMAFDLPSNAKKQIDTILAVKRAVIQSHVAPSKDVVVVGTKQ